MTAGEIISCVALLVYTIATVASNEIRQITDDKFDNPYAFRYIITVQKALVGILLILTWKSYRFCLNLSTNIIRKEKKYNSITWFFVWSILSGIICYVSGIVSNISSESHMTTVPTYTAISKTEPIPILIFSILFLKEKFTLLNIMAMILALTGILFYVLELSSSNHINYHNNKTYDTYTGIMLVMLSSIGYSISYVLTKKICIDCYEKDKFIIGSLLSMTSSFIFDIMLFFWNIFYPQYLDISLLMHQYNIFAWIMIFGIVSFVLVICIYIAIAFTSPFYMAIVSTLSIPLAFVVDVYIHDYKFNLYAVFGAIFVIISFFMLQIEKLEYNVPFCYKCCAVINKANTNLQSDQRKQLQLLNTAGNTNMYGAVILTRDI